MRLADFRGASDGQPFMPRHCEPYDEKLSEQLSTLLRHAGRKKSVNVRKDGFAHITQVLAVLGVDEADLTGMMQASHKRGQPRFQWIHHEPTGLWIRATRKHSVDVDQRLLSMSPQECMETEFPVVPMASIDNGPTHHGHSHRNGYRDRDRDDHGYRGRGRDRDRGVTFPQRENPWGAPPARDGTPPPPISVPTQQLDQQQPPPPPGPPPVRMNAVQPHEASQRDHLGSVQVGGQAGELRPADETNSSASSTTPPPTIMQPGHSPWAFGEMKPTANAEPLQAFAKAAAPNLPTHTPLNDTEREELYRLKEQNAQLTSHMATQNDKIVKLEKELENVQNQLVEVTVERDNLKLELGEPQAMPAQEPLPSGGRGLHMTRPAWKANAAPCIANGAVSERSGTTEAQCQSSSFRVAMRGWRDPNDLQTLIIAKGDQFKECRTSPDHPGWLYAVHVNPECEGPQEGWVDEAVLLQDQAVEV